MRRVFSLSLYVSPRYTSVSLRFAVRVVVFPLQPFSTQQQKQQKRWIDKINHLSPILYSSPSIQ
jgi:hypothetical protein